MAGYRPYTLGSGNFDAPAAAPTGGAHYYKRKKWWMRVAIVLLCLGV
jgi:hypothetical protein